MDEPRRRRVRQTGDSRALQPGDRAAPGRRAARPRTAGPRPLRRNVRIIAAHSRLGINVVVDVGHHDAYAVPRDILSDCARRLAGLPALLVGVLCPIEVIMERRNAGQAGREDTYVVSTPGRPIPGPVRRWQEEVHVPGIYDLEVDTSLLTPQQCAEAIKRRLSEGPPPTAMRQLASR